MTEITDLSTTDAANTSISTESLEGNVANMGRMEETLQAVMGLLARSIRTNVLRFLDHTDDTKKLALDLSGLTTATTRTWTAPDKNGTVAMTSDIPTISPPRGHIYGLTLSNNTTDAANDIDIAAGDAASDDSPATLITLASAITKRLDASWAAGTNQGMLDGSESSAGTPDTSTWYHIFAIKNPTSGVVDVLASESFASPSMPSGYTKKRRIGSVFNTSGGGIRAFTQDGNYFEWNSLVADVSAVAPGSSAVTRTLSVPTGLRLRAKVHASVGGTDTLLLSALSSTDEGANSLSAMLGGANPPSGNYTVMTNTSGQIRSRMNSGAGSLTIQTRGWFDLRGAL